MNRPSMPLKFSGRWKESEREQFNSPSSEAMPGDDDTLTPLFSVTPLGYQRAYETVILREHEIRFERMRESYEFSIVEA